MFKKLFSKWQSDRKLKAVRSFLKAVNALDSELRGLSDEELAAETDLFMKQSAYGEAFESLLPRVFAVVREAAFRTLGKRPYDVQVMGGFVLYRGAIAEMATGEGKTLTAPFAAYAHFLQGTPVHISTANSFLAERDARTMLPLFNFLRMTVGVCAPGQNLELKRKVYSCDVLYGTHGEFAMDYLRDRLVKTVDQLVQVRGLGFALVDEADSALIDDARTPVVINANRDPNANVYHQIADIATKLTRSPDATSEGDFYVDGKLSSAVLTDTGYAKTHLLMVEQGLLPATSSEDALYLTENQHLLHKLSSALAAFHVIHRDHHYVVQDSQVVVVDSMTGRLMPGRRWDGGLQQAIEAKEGLALSPENMVLAIQSLQNYFKRYKILSGMTGTATVEAEELGQVYGLEVVTIPTNKPCIRIDEPDRIFRTQAAKLAAVVDDIIVRQANGQPILVGTASVEQSETLSQLLHQRAVPHEVLNARQHAREAEIIAQAGKPGAITVSTNMAGRGVDIVLGGSVGLDIYHAQLNMGPEAWAALSDEARELLIAELTTAQQERAALARKAGGLHILGLERYDSRRMDKQLRGRAGRQGDPGSSCFYISLEDPLVENFAGESIRHIFTTLDIKPGDELEAALVTKAIDGAQREIEGRSYDIRKQLMQYDNVLNEQREAFYAHRQEILHDYNVHDMICRMRDAQAKQLSETYASSAEFPENWDLSGLTEKMLEFQIALPALDTLRDMASDQVAELICAEMKAVHEKTAAQADEPYQVNNAERLMTLEAMDRHWFGHLAELDSLRKGIHLRGYANVNPLQAYKREAFKLFDDMLEATKVDIVKLSLTWKLVSDPDITSQA